MNKTNDIANSTIETNKSISREAGASHYAIGHAS